MDRGLNKMQNKNKVHRNITIAQETEHINEKFPTKLYRIGNSLFLHVPLGIKRQLDDKVRLGLFPKGALKANVNVEIFPEVA